jgi:hypothetical protein
MRVIKMDKIKEIKNQLIARIGVDKIAHFGVCFFLMDLLIRRLDINIILAIIIILGIGVFKEFIDDEFNMDDICADALGIILYIL